MARKPVFGRDGAYPDRIAKLGEHDVQAVIPTSSIPLSGTRAVAAAPAILAAFLGLFMVWGVGFSDISAVHNAAHDVRHASAFPCH
jgi:cobalt transporter subunit CbtB